jgi:protein-disulfide isomerase
MGWLFFAYPAGSYAQEIDSALDELKREVEALKQGQAAMRQQLAEIKKLLRPKQRPQPVTAVNIELDVTGDPYSGDSNASVTLVEFTDYQCPFCARHVQRVMPQIERDYVESGKLKYVLRDFPLNFHKDAAKAAEAAHCASEQGDYWEMHHELFQRQKALKVPALVKYAEGLGLDVTAFQECLESGRYTDKVAQGLKDGQRVGVRGTPSFLVGLTRGDGTAVAGTKLIRGAVAYPVFKQTIDQVLATASR